MKPIAQWLWEVGGVCMRARLTDSFFSMRLKSVESEFPFSTLMSFQFWRLQCTIKSTNLRANYIASGWVFVDGLFAWIPHISRANDAIVAEGEPKVCFLPAKKSAGWGVSEALLFQRKAEDEDGGVFVEKIKSRDVKLGSAATKKRAKRRSEVLKLPNLPE